MRIFTCAYPWNFMCSLYRTNRASDRYFEHSKSEYHEPHKDSWDWQDWGLTLEALPPRRGGSAECPKRTRGEWDAGVENKNTQNTRINLNKWKLGEPSVYLKPVEQTLYSAAVPVKKSQKDRLPLLCRALVQTNPMLVETEMCTYNADFKKV